MMHICTQQISKEKSLRTHHQWDHQYIHVSGATLDNKWTHNPSIFGHGFPKTEARILGFGNVRVQTTEFVTEFTSDQMDDQRDNHRDNHGGNHGDDRRVDQRLDQRLNWKSNRDDQWDDHGDDPRDDPRDDPGLTGDQAEISDPDSCPLTSPPS